MKRFLVGSCASLLLLCQATADDKPKAADKGKAPEDSPLVKRTREVTLAEKISVEFKDERLNDCLKEFKNQIEDLSFHLEAGVSGNQAFSYSAKDKPLREVLDEMFKGRGLGYLIGRKLKDGDRYEGWLIITQGEERGDPIVKGQSAKAGEPKPAKPEAGKPKPAAPANDAAEQERLASSKLKQVRIFLENGMADDAKDYCEQILKRWPKTKAAVEAKKLLEKLKK